MGLKRTQIGFLSEIHALIGRRRPNPRGEILQLDQVIFRSKNVSKQRDQIDPFPLGILDLPVIEVESINVDDGAVTGPVHAAIPKKAGSSDFRVGRG